jgi:hypothetical protein
MAKNSGLFSVDWLGPITLDLEIRSISCNHME